MPKVNLSRFSQKDAPPIDWLRAAILERKMAFGYDLKELAAVGGVSYEYMRRIYGNPPSAWPHGVLENICKEFGITLVPSVNGSTPGEVFNTCLNTQLLR